MRSRTTYFAAFVALALLASACTGSDDTATTLATTTTLPPATTTTTGAPSTTTTTVAPPSAFSPADCEFDLPMDRAVECGWLEVPADRTNPDDGTIRLHVAIFASENPNPAPDPVVYLEGGPGGDALELAGLVFEDNFSHLLADRDVIIFDQRGTGFSEPSLACPEITDFTFDIIDQDLPADEYITLQFDVLSECRDRLIDGGVNLDAYTSAANAADVADLRVALGIDEWNLFGISYGTRLALTTMRDHPEGIRSVVLDSVYPPNVDVITEGAPNFDRALRTLFDGCAADAACNDAYPDVEATFYRLIEDLEAAPLTMTVANLFTGESYDAVLDGATLGGIVFQSLYSDEAIPALPQLIDNVASGDTYETSVLASAFLANLEFFSIGMQLAVQCNEESGFTSLEMLDATLDDYPQLATIFETSANGGRAFFDVCTLWDVGTAAPLENEPVTSDIPTLLVAGEYDPITPPAWAMTAAETLSSSTLIEIPGFGHGPTTSSDCAKTILRAFLNEPESALDTTCVAEMGPPEFLTPATALPDVTLVPFSTDFAGVTLSGVVPEEWEEAGPGVWARGASGFDQTAIIQQFAAGAQSQLVLNLLAAQFGLGDAPEPAETYDTTLGAWSLYEGSIAGTPATIALLETDAGTALVALLTTPGEKDRLRDLLLLPVLDALTPG